MMNNSSSNIQDLTAFSNATFVDQKLNLPSVHTINQQPVDSSVSAYVLEEAETLPISETLLDSSPPLSTTSFSEKNKSLVSNKRKTNNNRHEAEEKPKEVIRVRAKRGQATDSHSLAERVRREKINEKLKYLQDLAMGMAVMLDVIIDYVQSLQQQIEFLSMKLSAASMHFDVNTSEMNSIEISQKNTDTCEVQEMEKMREEGFEGFFYFNPTWPLH